ncbi:VOC family protein (plasmid) [Vagococcus sp. JNUCC 83]
MEFYIMPAFNKIMVEDITKSAKWYENALGFSSLFKFRNEKSEVIMDHLRLSKYQDIMLIQADNFTVGNGLRLNLSVDNIDDIEKNYRKMTLSNLKHPNHGMLQKLQLKTVTAI